MARDHSDQDGTSSTWGESLRTFRAVRCSAVQTHTPSVFMLVSIWNPVSLPAVPFKVLHRDSVTSVLLHVLSNYVYIAISRLAVDLLPGSYILSKLRPTP